MTWDLTCLKDFLIEGKVDYKIEKIKNLKDAL